MPPRLLVLVQPAGRRAIPVRQPQEWKDVSCATCDRVISEDPVLFLVMNEVRCRLCLENLPQRNGCIWCGRRPARVQDTGLRMCQPCWTIYVAYVADEVEPPDSPFRQLVADVYRITRKEEADAQVSAGDDPPKREDRATGERDPGPELGEDQRLPR